MTDPVTRLNAALQGRYRIERFLAEIKTTANLQHPHILPLFDSGQADSFLFYVMPYVEGDSLRDRLDRLPVPMPRPLRLAAALLIASVAIACQGDDPTETTDPPVATTVTLSATTLGFSSLEDTQQLTATVRDPNGTIMNGASVEWVSSAPTVVSVSSTGLVTAVADGSTEISASTGAASAVASATVSQVVETITISPRFGNVIPVGGSVRLTAAARDAGGSPIVDSEFEWSSSESSRIAVDQTGLTQGIADGTAEVSAAFRGMTGSVLVAVGDPLALEACRLSGSEQEAFPIDLDYFMRPVGTLRAVVLYIDFDQAVGTGDVDGLFDAMMPRAAEWFHEDSDGHATLDAVSSGQWSRMPKALTEYYEDDIFLYWEYVKDAVLASDSFVDFQDVAFVYFVAAPASDIVGSPGFQLRVGSGVTVDGTEVRLGAMLGTEIWSNEHRFNFIVHETGHSFGLPDLALYDTPDWLEAHGLVGAWDCMSSNIVGPCGHFVTWHKWKIGWLADEEVDCMGLGEFVIDLHTFDHPGGIKTVVVPTSAGTAYVIEARRRTGFDAPHCEEGVLIYTVDANVRSGSGPIRVKRAREDTEELHICGPSHRAPFSPLEGGVATFQDAAAGLTVEVLREKLVGFEVRVRRESLD